MISTLSVKGHRCVTDAFVTQGKILHLCSLVGTRESVRAIIAALQHGQNGDLKSGSNPVPVSLNYQRINAVQARLPSGAFQAVIVGERVKDGTILVLQPQASLVERFYHYLIQKSTLPLHSAWQDELLELAQTTTMLEKLPSLYLKGYGVCGDLTAFEGIIRRAIQKGELPDVRGEACG